MTKTDKFKELSERISEFCHDRDWEQFHNPKNLSMALAVEAAELMEIFQWLTSEESQKENLPIEKREKITEEIADVIIYCIRMAQMMDIDLLDAVEKKINKNESKYPVDIIKGKATL